MNTKNLQKIFLVLCGAAFLLWVFWDVQESPGMIHSLLAQLMIPIIVVGVTAMVVTAKELKKLADAHDKSTVIKVIYFYAAYTIINILIPFILPPVFALLVLLALIVIVVILFKQSLKLTNRKAILCFLAAQLGTYAVIEIVGTIFVLLRSY